MCPFYLVMSDLADRIPGAVVHLKTITTITTVTAIAAKIGTAFNAKSPHQKTDTGIFLCLRIGKLKLNYLRRPSLTIRSR